MGSRRLLYAIPGGKSVTGDRMAYSKKELADIVLAIGCLWVEVLRPAHLTVLLAICAHIYARGSKSSPGTTITLQDLRTGVTHNDVLLVAPLTLAKATLVQSIAFLIGVGVIEALDDPDDKRKVGYWVNAQMLIRGPYDVE